VDCVIAGVGVHGRGAISEAPYTHKDVIERLGRPPAVGAFIAGFFFFSLSRSRSRAAKGQRNPGDSVMSPKMLSARGGGDHPDKRGISKLLGKYSLASKLPLLLVTLLTLLYLNLLKRPPLPTQSNTNNKAQILSTWAEHFILDILTIAQ
jgi:hypothetical protein